MGLAGVDKPLRTRYNVVMMNGAVRRCAADTAARYAKAEPRPVDMALMERIVAEYGTDGVERLWNHGLLNAQEREYCLAVAGRFGR